MMPNPLGHVDEAARVRLLSKVALPNEEGCCLWLGCTDDDGYGKFRLGGRAENGGRVVRAHRLIYTLVVGPIPDGLQIDHRCHVPACCAPDHLRPATNKQNHENVTGARADSTTRILGVYKVTKDGRVCWLAKVVHNGHQYHLGYHPDPAKAEAAAIAGRLRLFTHNDADRVTS